MLRKKPKIEVKCPGMGLTFYNLSDLNMKFIRKVWVLKNPDLAPSEIANFKTQSCEREQDDKHRLQEKCKGNPLTILQFSQQRQKMNFSSTSLSLKTPHSGGVASLN